MRGAVIAGSVVAAVLVSGAATVGGYWHYKVAPLMASAALKVVPHAFVPVTVGELRNFDLGYATFSLPASAAGEFYHREGKAVALFGPTTMPPYAMALFCPVDGKGGPYREYLGSVAVATGSPAMSWFEYQRFVLLQKPFTLREAITQGLKETRLRLVFLTSKLLCVGTATEVRVFERNGIGVLVFTHPQGNTRVMISSLATGSCQGVSIDGTRLNVDEIVGALSATYALKTADYSPDAVARQLDQVGIRLSPPTPR